MYFYLGSHITKYVKQQYVYIKLYLFLNIHTSVQMNRPDNRLSAVHIRREWLFKIDGFCPVTCKTSHSKITMCSIVKITPPQGLQEITIGFRRAADYK